MSSWVSVFVRLATWKRLQHTISCYTYSNLHYLTNGFNKFAIVGSHRSTTWSEHWYSERMSRALYVKTDCGENFQNSWLRWMCRVTLDSDDVAQYRRARNGQHLMLPWLQLSTVRRGVGYVVTGWHTGASALFKSYIRLTIL